MMDRSSSSQYEFGGPLGVFSQAAPYLILS
jgi:hypothetical protein